MPRNMPIKLLVKLKIKLMSTISEIEFKLIFIKYSMINASSEALKLQYQIPELTQLIDLLTRANTIVDQLIQSNDTTSIKQGE
jgi:hypothetical protein